VSSYQDALSLFDNLKAQDQLAFTVVFQRALILAFLQMTRVTPAMLTGLGESEVDIDEMFEDDDGDGDAAEGGMARQAVGFEFERADILVSTLNRIVAREPEFLRADFEFTLPSSQGRKKERIDRFWLCSFVTPDGPIDFAQAASRRGSDLLLLAALMELYRRGGHVTTFQELIERCQEATTGLDLKVAQCLNRMQAADQSIAAKILKARENSSADEDARRVEIEERAAWLWAVVAS
jgi:hypothetical protein